MKVFDSVKKVPLLRFVLLLCLLVTFIIFARVLTLTHYPDFIIYYNAALLLAHGENPYLDIGFIYPPLALFLLFPFTLMPLLDAEIVFTIISFACFLLAVYLLFKISGIRPLSLLGIFLWILCFSFFPAKFTLGMGQINNVVFLLTVVFIFFYARGRLYLSGTFLALSITLKLFPVLVLPYLVFSKQWRILIATVLTAFVLSFICFFISPSVSSHFLMSVVYDIAASWKGDYYNQSLSGFLMREVANVDARTALRLVLNILFIIASLFILWKSYRKNDLTIALLSIGLLISLTLIINPFSWQHHFIWLLVPLFISLAYVRNHGLSVPYYIILGAAYLMTALNIKNPSFTPTILQSHVLYGALLLYSLNIHLLLRASRKYDRPIFRH